MFLFSNTNHTATAGPSTQFSTATTSHPPSTTDHIVLDVGGVKYHTRKSTLKFSPFFAAMFSGRWTLHLLPDGSLPVDLIQDIFPTLLEYLQFPKIYPLLWTREKGFDYVAYTKLLGQADFLGLTDLKTWIQERKFLGAVRTSLKMEMHPGDFTWPHIRSLQIGWEADDVQLLQVLTCKIPSEGQYICSRGIPEHAEPEDCYCSYDDDGCLPRDWQQEPGFVLPRQQLDTSILTVIKYLEFFPEACLKK
jgi:hypothetical protein